jgi:hypothetical protein
MAPCPQLLRDAPDFAISLDAHEPQSSKGSGGSRMHIDPKKGSPEMDYAEHMRTYSLFCKLTLWTIISAAGLMAIMGYFLT